MYKRQRPRDHYAEYGYSELVDPELPHFLHVLGIQGQEFFHFLLSSHFFAEFDLRRLIHSSAVMRMTATEAQQIMILKMCIRDRDRRERKKVSVTAENSASPFSNAS